MRTVANGTWRDEICGDNEISVYEREDGKQMMEYSLFDLGMKGRRIFDPEFFNLNVKRFDMMQIF